MDITDEVYTRLTEIMDSCASLNFGIRFTPEQLQEYINTKVRYMMMDAPIPDAAVFITHEGECGFISSHVRVKHKHLIRGFLEQTKRGDKELWCRVQKNNKVVNRFVNNIGFKLINEDVGTNYYIYTGV